MQKLVIGPFKKGLRNDVTAFNIDNDSFPQLINAYQWRGRVKRKRGTSLLNRLKVYVFTTTIDQLGSGTHTIINDLLDATPLAFRTRFPNAQIVPKTLVATLGTAIYTDTLGTGILTVTGTGGLNGAMTYNTGIIDMGSVTDFTDAVITVSFSFYPGDPVMGLEDLSDGTIQYAGTLAFDTVYSYNCQTTAPYDIYNVSYFKNPPAGATLPSYVAKTTWTEATWNGEDYQQFWTTNYQNAFWATNGIDVPFTGTNLGMQFGTPTVTARTSSTTMDFTITGNPLVVGDFVFVNEFLGTAGGDATLLNFQTGYVTTAGDTFTVTFPFANIPAGTYDDGIVQYLTNRSDITKDTIRWYDGDPTNGNSAIPTPSTGLGWVNFMPPLSRQIFSINDLPEAQYYLVGARLIVPFKDRLLFLGVVVQTSTGPPIYLQDTVIYSQNGTPYYTASFDGDPSLPTTVFRPILVPSNQIGTPTSYWGDQTGLGGFIAAGLDEQLTTVDSNQDVLLAGFTKTQTKIIYSGNDIQPFNFFFVNSELGSGSTFSAITLDKGVMTRGDRGFVITSQVDCSRFDNEIVDEVFQLKLQDNGAERFTAARDYLNEWIYFTYPVNNRYASRYRFPNQTLQYNYRDQSWAIFNETYTTYGQFRRKTGYTWATIGTIFKSWAEWNEPWNAGSSTLLQPQVIAGNQQGFVMVRDEGTGEGTSLSIFDIVGGSTSTVTSYDHCLNKNDYIMIDGAIGSIAPFVNGKIFQVANVPTKDTFILNPSIPTGAYHGLGVITRMYVPFIQTKQFPLAWEMARKTRLGVQRYLFTTTERSEVTLLIYLSQNAASPYNEGGIVPDINTVNNSLIYSTVLFTCPESTNLGLTPANINLNTPTATQQSQLWHRMNTSLIGDTVQLGITLSDAQMRTLTDEGLPISQFAEIELHSIILEASPSALLV